MSECMCVFDLFSDIGAIAFVSTPLEGRRLQHSLYGTPSSPSPCQHIWSCLANPDTCASHRPGSARPTSPTSATSGASMKNTEDMRRGEASGKHCQTLTVWDLCAYLVYNTHSYIDRTRHRCLYSNCMFVRNCNVYIWLF